MEISLSQVISMRSLCETFHFSIFSGVSNEGIAALVLLFGLIVIFAAYVFLRPGIQHCIRK